MTFDPHTLNLDTFFADHPELRPPEQMVRALTFLSVCDGMGCASLAFTPIGWRQVLSSEIEAAPRAVLEHRLGARDMRRSGASRLPLWGDMAALRIRHLRRFGIDLPDLLCGGTPCQGFSVAGLRGGMSDPRGTLTLTFIRLANALDAARYHGGQTPIVIFWENVPGILSMPGNPFGHVLAGLVGEDTPIQPVRGKWTDAGLAVGPRRAAAWRILDAQYRGLAQRRERLFVVASARDGFDPAAVLFEPEGVRRHSPPSRETGQSIAPTIAGGARKRGGYSTDDIPLAASFGERGFSDYSLDALPCLRAKGGEAGSGSEALTAQAFGGNNTSGPIEVATALNAHGGPCGRIDFESETFVTCVTGDVTHALTAEGCDAGEDGTGRGTPIIAFSCKDHGADATDDLAPELRAMGHADSHANAGGQLAVAFALRGREDGAVPEVEGDGQAVGALRAASGGSSRDYVAFAQNQRDVAGALAAEPGMKQQTYVCRYGVRRLTPTECERLQGVPDGYTLVPHRGKPMADGPRYKMLGNGWAVPVIRWIGDRIAAEVAISSLQTVDRDGQAGRVA